MAKEIHIFSGLGSSIVPGLSYGTRTLERMVDKLGANAEHHIWNTWKAVAEGIIDRRNKSKVTPKVALIGHSNGVIAITEIAERLRLAGIPVQYMGAIDPTAGAFPAVNNAELIDEFWASSGIPQMARRLTNNKRGAIHHGPGFKGVHKLWMIPGGHVPCASDPKVQKIILNSIKEALA